MPYENNGAATVAIVVVLIIAVFGLFWIFTSRPATPQQSPDINVEVPRQSAPDVDVHIPAPVNPATTTR